MKYLIKKSGLVIIGFSIVFMLGNCGGAGESKKAEGTKETANEESTTSEDAEKSTETVSESYNLEEGCYYDFQANVQIPVITRYTEIYEKFDERTKDDEVEKETYIQLVVSIKNVKLDGNKFSGIAKHESHGSSVVNNENWNSWEGKKPHGTNNTYYRCSGEFSEDGKMIKYIEIESLWFAHYGEKSGAYGIEKRRDFIIMKDIPVHHTYAQDINFKEFQFKHEPTIKVYGSNRFLKDAVEIISSITDADKIDYSAKQWLNMNREGKVTWDVWDEKEETLIKINQEYISRNKDNWPISFRRGEKIPEQVTPVTHITIEGPDTICRCVAKQKSKKNRPCKIKLIAKSNITAGSFKWECESEAILLQSTEGNSSEIKVRALAEYLPSPDSVLIKVTQKIGADEYSATHILYLRGGYYYFWPDCRKLYELGMITESELKECEDDLDKCEDSLRLMDVHDENGILIIEQDGCNQELAVKYLPLILEEHLLSTSGLADPDFKLDSEELNWFYKLWDENGDPYPEEERAQTRDFVQTLPCMKKWVELGNRKK